MDQKTAKAKDPTPATSPVAESPLPRLVRSRVTGQPVAGHPLAQASQLSKVERLRGKGVRFEKSRKYMGVLIGFLVLLVGYIGFIGFSAFWKYYSNAAQKRAADIANKIKDADTAKKKRVDELIAKVNALRDGQAGTTHAKTAAVNMADLAVTVANVRQGALFPPDQTLYLVVNLRIKNKSAAAGSEARLAWPPGDRPLARNGVYSLSDAPWAGKGPATKERRIAR